MSHKEFLTEKRKEKAYEVVESLYSAHNSFRPILEDLHTLFISYALDEDKADPDVVASYSNLRYFLKNSEELFQEEK